MAKQMIKYELIANESKRKLTFKKRRSGLLKKMEELTTLCGVMGFAIIYSTFHDQPEIWPSPPELIRILDEFKDLPKRRRDKYSVNQKAFLRRNISRIKKLLDKERQRNQRRGKELTLTQFLAGRSFQDMTCTEDSKELVLLLEEKIKFINDKIETMDKSSQVTAENGNKN